ncbi:DUF3140 domain-containing protein [Actinoallomurus iriomotensis]|uniref:DNA-binding protein n=1 Tax=Actinoallomurus iriomotensis TaxID=478107 RepID=A0A9W6SDG1_9ACTN|nr:DUF3140 domain-containing protein [Actinoallomurus iriomotensis]GLY91573.1 DNA-binding protein [Actinoallomurus iriomotensis]
MAGEDDEEIRGLFRDLVNLTPTELERWLGTAESKSAGQPSGGGESTGHESGRRIVALLRTPAHDLSEDDHAHMRKVVGYIRRHLAQRPDGDVRETRWRHSLMNWGHDPLKD